MSRRPSPGSRLRRDVVVFVAGLLAIAAALSVSPSPASAAPAAPTAPARPAAPNYPWSSLEAVAVWGNTMVAGGWSWDPDTRGTIKILAAVDVVNTKLALATTGGYRPDVAPVAGGRRNTGFGIAIGGLAPGNHLMCIAAQNVGTGEQWRLFGCRNFAVANVNPIGNLEAVQSQGDRAVASGWTADSADRDPERGPHRHRWTTGRTRPCLGGAERRRRGLPGVGQPARVQRGRADRCGLARRLRDGAQPRRRRRHPHRLSNGRGLCDQPLWQPRLGHRGREPSWRRRVGVRPRCRWPLEPRRDDPALAVDRPDLDRGHGVDVATRRRHRPPHRRQPRVTTCSSRPPTPARTPSASRSSTAASAPTR